MAAVDVSNLPESELDYWAKLALLGSMVAQAEAMNTFDSESEYANNDLDLDVPVFVDYAEDDDEDEFEENPVMEVNEKETINKSFFDRFKRSAKSVYDKNPQFDLEKSGEHVIGLKKRPIC